MPRKQKIEDEEKDPGLPKRPRRKLKPLVKPEDVAGLTPRQEEFVHQHVGNPNTREAARDSGIAIGTGYQMLYNAKVQASLQAIRQRHAERLEVNNHNTLLELARIAFSDIRNLFNGDGSLRNLTELDEDTARAVSAVEIQEIYEGEGKNRKFVGYAKQIKFWSKTAALDKLARHLGLVKDAVHFSGKVDVEVTPKFDWDAVPLDVRRQLLAEVRRQEAAAGLQADPKQLPCGFKELVDGEVLNGRAIDAAQAAGAQAKAVGPIDGQEQRGDADRR